MAQVAAEAGLPAGVLNVVNGLGAEAGQALVEADGIDVLSFTGSTRVGRMIGESAGRRLLKVSLELGGKNALIVCDDADLDAAAKWACLAAFSNAGQRCAAGSRIIVMADVYDAFVQRYVAATRSLKLGVAADCDVGPVINARQLDAMLAALKRALDGGATILAGGKKAMGAEISGGFYLQPTILADIAQDAEASVTELFGPITALYRAKSFEDALVMANESPYGLTASIHTTRLDRAFRFIETMKTGVAVVNGGTHGSEPHMPFGGVKSSGNGSREPGTEALDVYSNLKDVYINMKA
jgi:aldehyde dehydrogenase (NAD+)